MFKGYVFKKGTKKPFPYLVIYRFEVDDESGEFINRKVWAILAREEDLEKHKILMKIPDNSNTKNRVVFLPADLAELNNPIAACRTYADFESAVESLGEKIDIFNPGRAWEYAEECDAENDECDEESEEE